MNLPDYHLFTSPPYLSRRIRVQHAICQRLREIHGDKLWDMQQGIAMLVKMTDAALRGDIIICYSGRDTFRIIKNQIINP